MKRGEGNGATGVSFFGVMLAVFIALKLAHVINWSWWLVLAPLWFEIIIVIIVIIVILWADGPKDPRDPFNKFKY